MGSIFVGLAALLVALLTPAVLLQPVEAVEEQPRFLVIEDGSLGQKDGAEFVVRLKAGQAIEELPLEDYLIGVVLSEMPMSFEPEALKAQAIAARTFAMRQLEGGKHQDFDLCDQSSCCQAWTGEAALSEKLGNCWESYWDKAAGAVKATSGQILTYNGELIDAVYFSCSGGATEDAVAVWGGKVPYLQSVESPGEEDAGKYHTTVTCSRDEFCRIILQAQPLAELSGRMDRWLESVTRTQGGGVAEMKIGGCSFTGTDLRSLFGLNSTNFTLAAKGDTMVFSVYGYGHRVGMSQYGANAMAKSGKTCQEILSHYYSGAEIEAWQ